MVLMSGEQARTEPEAFGTYGELTRTEPEMFETDDELTREVEPETVKMGVVERLIALFFSPGKLMANIGHYPVVGVPLVAAIVVSLLSLPLLADYTEITTRECSYISLERYGVDYFNLVTSDFDDMGDAEALNSTINAITNVSTAVSAVVSYPVMAFFAALWLFIVTKIARGGVKLITYYSMYMHIYIIAALGSALVMFLGNMSNTMLDLTSLAAVFMPKGDITSLLFCLLMTVNIFGLWQCALVYVGTKEIAGFSAKRAAVVTLIVYFSTVLVTAGSTASTFFVIDLTNDLLGSIPF
jgi:hypothetical protein